MPTLSFPFRFRLKHGVSSFSCVSTFTKLVSHSISFCDPTLTSLHFRHEFPSTLPLLTHKWFALSNTTSTSSNIVLLALRFQLYQVLISSCELSSALSCLTQVFAPWPRFFKQYINWLWTSSIKFEVALSATLQVLHIRLGGVRCGAGGHPKSSCSAALIGDCFALAIFYPSIITQQL